MSRHSVTLKSVCASAALLMMLATTGWADVKIWPLGDSNTGVDPTLFPDSTNLNKYRQGLYSLLSADGYVVDFVGTQDSGQAGLDDRDHEGHGGYWIGEIAYGPGKDPNNPTGGVAQWLTAMGPSQTPDIVLLMIGTNDVIAGSTARSQAPAWLSHLIDLLVGELPDARILVSTIPPLASPYTTTDNNNFVVPFNDSLREIVLGKGGNVQLVDAYAALTTADMSADGLHLTAAGYDKLAEVWYDAIVVPEPATLSLLIVALPAGLVKLARRRIGRTSAKR